MSENSNFTPQLTADGSYTFFSEEFAECFHSIQGAKAEALQKFVEPCQLSQKAQNPRLRILDICYGLGYNTATALEVIWQHNPNCYVELVALELDISVPKTALSHNLLSSWSQPIPKLLEALATSLEVQTNCFQGKLILGDARTTIHELQTAKFQADAVFLDPFSPPHCPQLWTREFIHLVANCCEKTGRIATYSCAAAVRTALLEAGLQISPILPLDGRQPGTLASFTDTDLPPLCKKAQEHLQTRAAVPYSDPFLKDSAQVILQRRQSQQQKSSLEPTSHWNKRWSRQNL
jgi:tRNA U34 5-methylaminomethyl-2-thiouridine-forming methyltransferase MnmC